jgi:hypothetical protein
MKNWGTNWADQHIADLRAGKTVQFRPHGDSMRPLIKSGQLVTCEPLQQPPKVGDIVLCLVGTKQYVHLVKALGSGSVQIGNNHGKINGWASLYNVFGIVVKVEP